MVIPLTEGCAGADPAHPPSGPVGVAEDQQADREQRAYAQDEHVDEGRANPTLLRPPAPRPPGVGLVYSVHKHEVRIRGVYSVHNREFGVARVVFVACGVVVGEGR